MKAKGLTTVEIIISVVLILIVGVILLLGVLDTRRRSRDAQVISNIRQVQFDLNLYRNSNASFPQTILDLYDFEPGGFVYAAAPEGCAEDSETFCSDYAIDFLLEGRIGDLAGGVCRVTSDSITCAQ